MKSCFFIFFSYFQRFRIFAISLLQQIDASKKETQSLVLAPTRELAQQIIKVVLALGDYMDIQAHPCIGGTNVRQEHQRLQQNPPHVIVGTPGRVYGLFEKRNNLQNENFTNLTFFKHFFLGYDEPRRYRPKHHPNVCFG